MTTLRMAIPFVLAASVAHAAGATTPTPAPTAHTTTHTTGRTTAANAHHTRSRASAARAVAASAARTNAPVARAAAPSANVAPRSSDDSTMTLRGDREGTAFRSLTIEGEDRVHLDIARPDLTLDLDPLAAPGLEPGSARDVLERDAPDADAPLLAATAAEPCPYLAHPWLRQFATGVVARFHPQAEHAERWQLVIADSRGRSVATFAGHGEPPSEIAWDGRTTSGEPVVPGLTYSYAFEAHDRAGNKRSVVGEPFQVPAYRLTTSQGPLLVFSGAGLADDAVTVDAGPAGAIAAPPILIEAANVLDESAAPQAPVRVTVTARSYERASDLADYVTGKLAALSSGDPARFHGVPVVEADAPDRGTVSIATASRTPATR